MPKYLPSIIWEKFVVDIVARIWYLYALQFGAVALFGSETRINR
jgi:hypothetical protein